MIEPQDCESLDEIRAQIDRLDRSLVNTIGLRQEYVHAAASFKHSQEQVHAHERQCSMVAARRLWAEIEGVDPDLIESLFRTMVDHSIKAEMAVFSNLGNNETDGQTSSSLSDAVDAGRPEGADSKGS